MKKLILITGIIATMAFTINAQNSAVDKLFDKYAGEDGFTSVTITKAMFSLFSNIESSEEDDFLKATSQLDNIKILTAERKVAGLSFYKILSKELNGFKDYEELMVVKEKNSNVKFLLKRKGKIITEFLMVVSGGGDNTIICISGKIDLKTIAKISKSMNIQGLDMLGKVKNGKNNKIVIKKVSK